MTTRQRLPLLILGALLTGGAIIELPHAQRTVVSQVVRVMNIQTMAKEAELVITGKVVGNLGTLRDIGPAGEDMVFTRWRIRPEKELKRATTNEIVVRTLGGQYLTTIIDVEDQPTFTVGERVTLFLRQPADWKGDYRTVGEFQGKFRLEEKNGKRVAIQSETNKEQSLGELEQTVQQVQ